jgi:hypothetical protein
MINPTFTLDREVPPPAWARDPDWADQAVVAERQAGMLRVMGGVGVRLTLVVERDAQAVTPEGEAAAGSRDWGLIYARLSRAVRMTLAMEARVVAEHLERLAEADEAEADAEDAEAQEAVEAETAREADAEQERLDDYRRAVQRVVEETLGEDDAEPQDVYEQVREARENLENGDDYQDFQDRPVGETIARICADLGLTPDWSRWAQEPWAVEEARDKPAGSPYARRAWRARTKSGARAKSGGVGGASPARSASP